MAVNPVFDDMAVISLQVDFEEVKYHFFFCDGNSKTTTKSQIDAFRAMLSSRQAGQDGTEDTNGLEAAAIAMVAGHASTSDRLERTTVANTLLNLITLAKILSR